MHVYIKKVTMYKCFEECEQSDIREDFTEVISRENRKRDMPNQYSVFHFD